MFRDILLLWRRVIVISKNALARFTGAVLIYFTGSASAMSKAPEGYLPIFENNVESEKYELSKINIDFVPKVFWYDSINHNMIVSSRVSGGGSYVKINEKGYIIDRYSHRSTLLRSGVFFDGSSYVDWAISGDKAPQHYREVVDADKLSEEEFKHYINTADEVDYDVFYDEDKYARVYIKSDNSWSVLETVKRFDDFSSNINGRHYEVNSTVYPKKQNNRLISLSPQTYQKSWEHPDNIVSIVYFNEEGQSSSRFMDINNRTWDGEYGTGYFKLKYQDETLYFKAHTTKSYSRFDPDLEIYMTPEKLRSKINRVFITLSKHSKNKRTAEEAGLYVLREKAFE